MKDEKILKKVGKLLKLYGVDEEEAQKFIADLQDKKYDDQEEINESEEAEETVEAEEKPTDVVGGEEESTDEELVDVEESAEDVEETEEVEEQPTQPAEQPMEQPSSPVEGAEEQPTEQPEEQAMGNGVDEVSILKSKTEELEKTNNALSSRIGVLEEIISKLGLNEEKDIGATPMANPVETGENDAFARINKKRIG